jgi:hypothetical protein
MATKYKRTGAGNWSAAASWSTTATKDATRESTGDTTVPAVGDDLVLDDYSGNLTIDAAATCKTLTHTGYTGTLAHNAFTLTAAILFVSGMTYTPLATSTISFSANATLTTGTQLMPLVKVTSGTLTLGDALAFMASKVMSITLTTGAALNLAGFVISGNSAINRVLITSLTLGTAVTVTTSTAGSAFANCDFRDVAFANGGSNLDLSASAGGAGDCGPSTTITGGGTLTMTASTPWFWYNSGAGTFNFSDYNHWFTGTGGTGTPMASTRCPLSQDNCRFDGASVTGATIVDQDMPRMCRSLDFTGVGAMAFHVNNVTIQTLYGGLTVVPNVEWTVGSSSFTFEGRDSFGVSMDTAHILVMTVSMIGGTLTSTRPFVSATLTITNGTFDSGNYNVNISGSMISSGNATRVLNMGSGIWSVTNEWSCVGTGLTLNSGTSTIVLSYTGANVKSFTGGSLVYNNLILNAGAVTTPALSITGSNSFNTLTINGPKTMKFTKGTTTTVRKFVTNGTGGNKQINLTTVDGQGQFTLKSTGGRQDLSGVSLARCQVIGGPWYARRKCFNRGNNSGIKWPQTFQPWAVTAAGGNRRRRVICST